MKCSRIAIATVAATALLASCASGSVAEHESIVRQNDAIDDFITVAKPEQVDEIRTMQSLHHKELTERYIIVSDKRYDYLAVFVRPCRELNDPRITPDYRSDFGTIRARFDTYRGCRIERLYKLSKGQAEELQVLGDAAKQ